MLISSVAAIAIITIIMAASWAEAFCSERCSDCL